MYLNTLWKKNTLFSEKHAGFSFYKTKSVNYMFIQYKKILLWTSIKPVKSWKQTKINKTVQFYFKPKKHIMHNYVNKHSMVGWHELQMNLHYSPRSNPHVPLWKYHVKWIKLQLKTVVSKFLDYNFLSEKRLIFFKFWSR